MADEDKKETPQEEKVEGNEQSGGGEVKEVEKKDEVVTVDSGKKDGEKKESAAVEPEKATEGEGEDTKKEDTPRVEVKEEVAEVKKEEVAIESAKTEDVREGVVEEKKEEMKVVERKFEELLDAEIASAEQPDFARYILIGFAVLLIVVWLVMTGGVVFDRYVDSQGEVGTVPVEVVEEEVVDIPENVGSGEAELEGLEESVSSDGASVSE